MSWRRPDAAHEDAAPAIGPQQRHRTDLRGEAAGHLGHRVEQREHPAGQLHRLVGDRCDLLGDQFLGQRLVGSQVQVGVEQQVLAQAVVFLGHRLLDLHDHVGLAPDVIGRVEDLGTCPTKSSSVIEEPTPASFSM